MYLSDLFQSCHTDPEQRNQCECSYCGRMCPYPSVLERHMRSHRDEKSAKCPTCGREFRDKHTLAHHLPSHTNERKFICTVCSKGFNFRSSLYRHMQRHTEEKQICNICQREFSTRYTLKEHMLIHTKKYAKNCLICGKGFAYASHYEAHLMVHVARGEGPSSSTTDKKQQVNRYENLAGSKEASNVMRVVSLNDQKEQQIVETNHTYLVRNDNMPTVSRVESNIPPPPPPSTIPEVKVDDGNFMNDIDLGLWL